MPRCLTGNPCLPAVIHIKVIVPADVCEGSLPSVTIAELADTGPGTLLVSPASIVVHVKGAALLVAACQGSFPFLLFPNQPQHHGNITFPPQWPPETILAIHLP